MDTLWRLFDRILARQTGFAVLDTLLANKAAMPMALERPEVPLHTNSAERAIRSRVIKRKINRRHAE